VAKIGYIRVSTEQQNLDRQEDVIKPITDKLFKDKASEKDINRPEFKRMMDYVREGDTLFIESISRLARSTKDLLQIVDELRTKEVGLVSLKGSIDTETPQGRFILQVFAALSELERESIKQRQREGIDAARRRGKKFGRPKLKKPGNWDEVTNDWKNGRIQAVDACKRLGLPRSTFYKIVRSEISCFSDPSIYSKGH